MNWHWKVLALLRSRLLRMANRQRGEIAAIINGAHLTLCLTLGALAELEDDLGAAHLPDLGDELTAGKLSARHVLLIIKAGLSGGGTKMSVDELAHARFDGGAMGAVKLAAELLAITFGANGDPQ